MRLLLKQEQNKANLQKDMENKEEENERVV